MDPKSIPAFPTVDANRPEDCGTAGMELRDYFAAKAMQALTAHHGAYCLDNSAEGAFGEESGAPTIDQSAEYAYAMADAMIEARK